MTALYIILVIAGYLAVGVGVAGCCRFFDPEHFNNQNTVPFGFIWPVALAAIAVVLIQKFRSYRRGRKS
jgi:hypothetical protein